MLLKGTFGGVPDSIYPGMRDVINANMGRFPLPEIIAHYKGSRKSISFTEDDIENLLDLQYGKARTYCALSLLYPGLNQAFKYHQDHLHPKALFHRRNLRKMALSHEQVNEYEKFCNSLANLQLLQANQNIEKSDKPFADWLTQAHPEQSGRDSFLMQHYISTDESLAFEDFLAFVMNRREKLRQHFIQILDVTQRHDTTLDVEVEH